MAPDYGDHPFAQFGSENRGRREWQPLKKTRDTSSARCVPHLQPTLAGFGRLNDDVLRELRQAGVVVCASQFRQERFH